MEMSRKVEVRDMIRICPRCGSKNIARYLYGYPLFDEKLIADLEAKKVVLGGCVIGSVEIDGEWVFSKGYAYCNDCKKDIDTPVIVFNKKKGCWEFYKDIVKEIRFSTYGYLSGYKEYVIKRDDGKIPAYEWDQIMDNLYSRIHIHEWKNKYTDEELIILDGEEWKVELILDGRRIRTYRGENMYPPHWRMFVKIFRDLEK